MRIGVWETGLYIASISTAMALTTSPKRRRLATGRADATIAYNTDTTMVRSNFRLR